MKAYEINPSAADGMLRLVNRADPEPRPGEVLVRIRAASLNYRDLLVADNAYGVSTNNLIPLSDGAGEVVALGAGVTKHRIGDRVAGAFYPDWISGPITAGNKKRGLGGTIDGVLAEYLVLGEDALIPFPEHLSFEEAATLPCAALTAWNALTEISRLRPGQTVLLQGTGGVSIFALQFAKAMGAQVFHISSSAEKLALLHEMGADHVLNYRENPDWDSQVLSLTNGRGVDVVVEVGGPGTLERSFRAVRVDGSIVTIGFVGGGAEINPRAIIGRAIRLTGISVGSADMFKDMNRAIGLHGLRPVIDEVFPFERAADAYAKLRAGRHFGKLVVAI
ncbi:NAD(P)-dependent alcohol dehydrogenase [Mesorhizobium sp. CGMCC 1.15528]|uniref:NAD(P)-dependent alcohol dehydrogenase n=1 Tax=Mesorhizobium zhangyense TaxID=1776730 RepID=A0A7C9VH95_9HYPH|nr:NAD(P)-dependent alcohol dehydrogenase [Mesorhizobium zhangyense]NGN44610.1 NAD(P)-dependent alcohol dehydrogenase [Mesorhizobium zhangyense]